VVGFEIFEALEVGDLELSALDQALAGQYSPEDVEECLALVRQHWSVILARAESPCPRGDRPSRDGSRPTSR
jgi:hypothetical protein